MQQFRPILFRYGGAVLVTALAVLVRWLLDPWLGDLLPLAVLFGAVAFAVWYGGSRPAVGAAAGGYLASRWLVMPPRRAFWVFDFPQVLALATYGVSCAIIIIFARAAHGARQDAEQQARRRGLAVQALLRQHEENEQLLQTPPAVVWIANDPDCRSITGSEYANR